MRRLTMSQLWLALFSSFLLIWSTSAVIAQEHPEHPQEKKKGEHSDHLEQAKAEKVTLTVNELAVAVKDYVEMEAEENDGYFSVKDDQQNKTLQLELTKVHEERLASLGDNVYFVCADFKGTDGNTYDIDIFMEGTSKDNLEATETSVHKMNGKERYTWHEEKGLWKKKSMGKTKKTSEHPEHPEGKEKSEEHPEGRK
jgi:hypothetical protein